MSVARRRNRWLARYRDDAGTEHTRTFDRKIDGERWVTEQKAKLQAGTWTDPKTARTTVAEWCATWLEGLHARPSTVKAARMHIKRINAEFGRLPLAAVRPSQVRAWTVKLRNEGLAPAYVAVLHARLSQIMADAVHDRIIPQSPCSRRTAPGGGPPRAYVATTRQVWNLHDAMPPHLRMAVLLGAFAGLRAGEACGLRWADVDFGAGMIRPCVQYADARHPAEPLKTGISQTAIPVPQSLVTELAAHMARYPGAAVLADERGARVSRRVLEHAMMRARARVPGLPDGFRFHDLRHYYASLLISSGADVKTVQARVRHVNAATTLDVYGHLWPDRDDSTRLTVEAVFAARADQERTGGDAR